VHSELPSVLFGTVEFTAGVTGGALIGLTIGALLFFALRRRRDRFRAEEEAIDAEFDRTAEHSEEEEEFDVEDETVLWVGGRTQEADDDDLLMDFFAEESFPGLM
jgi:hypothetical protein